MRDEHPWDNPRTRPSDMIHSDHLGADPRNFHDADSYYRARRIDEARDRMMRSSMPGPAVTNRHTNTPSCPAPHRSFESYQTRADPPPWPPQPPNLPPEHGRVFCGNACDCQSGCIPATPGWIAANMEHLRRQQQTKAVLRTIGIVLFVLLWFGFGFAAGKAYHLF